jgi:hypothetical protein
MNTLPSQDAAWVRIETPLSTAGLADFIGDTERLFRINSLLEILRWEKIADKRIALQARNLSNGKELNSQLRIERIEAGLRVHYSDQLKTSTSFQVEPGAGGGSVLIVTDDYTGTAERERSRRLDEVDRSLNGWGRDLHAYLHIWSRWSWLPPWRWYMRRVWQPMKPAARRITHWLLWITLGEMLLVLLLIAILAIEG